MTSRGRIGWLLILVFYLSGCSAYTPGMLPANPPPMQHDLDVQPPKVVEVGFEVELTLVTGKVVKGMVVEVDEDKIVFGKAGNYGLEKETYFKSEIAKIEIRGEPALAEGILITFGVITGVLVILGAICAMSCDFSGMN